jgi:hypothetical protein
VEPATGACFKKHVNDGGRLSASLTAGRIIDNKHRFRIDLWGAYQSGSDNGGLYSTAALFTIAEGIIFRNFVMSASIGAGISKRGNMQNIDAIVPVKVNLGYHITDNLLLGFVDLPVLNLSDYKKGSFYLIGLFMGIKW